MSHRTYPPTKLSLSTFKDTILEEYDQVLAELSQSRNKTLRAIFESAKGVFRDRKLLVEIFEIINHEPWSTANFDEIIQICEERFQNVSKADNSELYTTPKALVEAVVDTLKPASGEVISDLAAGSGSFLLEAQNYIEQRYALDESSTLQGIERSRTTYLIAHFRALLSGVDLQLKFGDSLSPLSNQLKESDSSPHDEFIV